MNKTISAAPLGHHAYQGPVRLVVVEVNGQRYYVRSLSPVEVTVNRHQRWGWRMTKADARAAVAMLQARKQGAHVVVVRKRRAK